MPVLGQGTKLPAKTVQPPPRAAAAPAPAAQQAPPPPPQGRGQNARSFGEAKTRNGGGIFLKPIDSLTAATYTVKVNRIMQKWANPRGVNPMFPQPTAEELATAEPTFKRQDNYIIECEVVESNNPLCPVGYAPSIIFTDKYTDSYMGDIKGFLAAICNAPPDEVTLEDWQGSYQPDQPLAGWFVKVIVRDQPNKNGKGSYTRHIFNVSPLQYPAEA